MPTRPRLRVGIVGAGFVAHIHGEGYRHVHGVDVELVSVTATRPERARAFAQRFGVARAVADHRAVLDDPEVDVVDLCAPSHHHAAMAIEAARAGKHVIVEKPLTGFFGPPDTPREEMLRRAVASADEVLAAVRAAGVRLCYAENWVYAPPIQKAIKIPQHVQTTASTSVCPGGIPPASRIRGARRSGLPAPPSVRQFSHRSAEEAVAADVTEARCRPTRLND